MSHLFLSPDEKLSRPTLITTFYACSEKNGTSDGKNIKAEDIYDFLEKNIYPAYIKMVM